MFRKTTIAALLSICICCTSLAPASEPNDYITPGRLLMFNGAVSGLRSAYQTFDDGIKDTGCPACSTNRELKFLRAITQTAMLVIRDNGGSIDSFLELAKAFDVELLGDSIDQLQITYPKNSHNAYQIPSDAPNAGQIRDIFDTSMIPEIAAIISDLNSISDSPANRFRIFFKPSETGLENNLEVDYAEVLLLKAILTALNGQLQFKSAYDMHIDANDMLMEKIYGKQLNINVDLLVPHPDFLKVLPTAGDSNNGAAVLAQVRQGWIEAINNYLAAIEYINNEEDPQSDDFLYIDPNDKNIVSTISSRLVTLRDSLINDTPGTYPLNTQKIYHLNNSETSWELRLNYNLIGFAAGDRGTFTALDSDGPGPWEITDSWTEASEISIDMDDAGPDGGGALFTGIISPDGNTITGGTFEYWGPENNTIYDLAGGLIGTEFDSRQFDLNPVFGSPSNVPAPRYASPVNPRDLLPEFDSWNAPLPGTVGHGLGNDANLGGILQDMTQYKWQTQFNLQPAGLFYLQELDPLQIDHRGGKVLWKNSQLVFSDISGDTYDPNSSAHNVDIKNLYMGYDDDYLYGLITFNNFNSSPTGFAWYGLYFSYTPNSEDSLHSIGFEIYLDDSSTWGEIYYMNDFGDCEYIGDFDALIDSKGINFRIDWDNIPGYLPGRFLTIGSDGSDSSYSDWNGEWNSTHLRIGELGSISGIVRYDQWQGGPILVQAYTDPAEPEDSVVASTIITKPGPYTLEGVGLGWEGYVRAFRPVFGFDNPFELSAFDIESATWAELWPEDTDGVDLVLQDPIVLQENVWTSGDIDGSVDEKDWYAIDAAAGKTYTISLNRGTSSYTALKLFDRDGKTKIVKLDYSQTQQIDWVCPISGRYYVRVANSFYTSDGGSYEIGMSSTCPSADIAGPGGAGSGDCKVNFYDYAVLAGHWLDNCEEPSWCDGSDFDRSGKVASADLVILVNEWLNGN